MKHFSPLSNKHFVLQPWPRRKIKFTALKYGYASWSVLSVLELNKYNWANEYCELNWVKYFNGAFLKELLREDQEVKSARFTTAGSHSHKAFDFSRVVPS